MPGQPKNAAGAERDGRLRLLGFVLLPLVIFPLLALGTYDWRDLAWLHAPPNQPPNNLIGVVGAALAFLGYMVLGLGVWLLPVWLVMFSLLMIMRRTARLGARVGWCALLTVAMCCLLQLGDQLFESPLVALNLRPNAGGAVGSLLMDGLLVRYLSPVGSTLIVLAVLVVAGVMAVGPRALLTACGDLAERWSDWRLQRADASARLAAEQRKLERKLAQEQRRAAHEARRAAHEQARAARVAERAERDRQKAGEQEREQNEQAARRQELEARAAAVRAAANAEARRLRPAPTAAPGAAAAVPPTPAPAAAAEAAGDAATAGSPAAPEPQTEYRLPTVELFDPTPPGEAVHGDTAATSRVIAETLAQFGIPVEVTHVECGPVVTSYEVLPAPGIRVERIAGMAKTLEMALKAISVRVEAPIPGKGVVGIEVPNTRAQAVTLREVLEGTRWAEAQTRMEIPLALGKDVGGRDMVIDLATVPHLLIAGATGSGKSVCINAILNGLLMSRTPEQLRLMLVDPKIVEFASYADLPHLVVPVITDPKKVSLGLRWAIHEMEKRYRLLHSVGVRNIVAFNRRELATQPDMFSQGGETAAAAPDPAIPRRLPYIVIVIDELADLMLQAGPEIENSVARLAQLSRAVGIHLLLATQRPSVNVITGTIKANFPGRIAFQVAQKVDSRTILDAIGAEALIGRGDMLFLDPRSSKLVRGQGAYLGDNEIKRVADFIRSQAKPVFIKEVQERLARATDDDEDETPASEGGSRGSSSGGNEGPDDEDALLEQAVQIIRETRRASTSSLQRRLRIGYTRAARLVDILEERGIVGPPRGSDPREILIDLDGEMPNNSPSRDENATGDPPESAVGGATDETP